MSVETVMRSSPRGRSTWAWWLRGPAMWMRPSCSSTELPPEASMCQASAEADAIANSTERTTGMECLLGFYSAKSGWPGTEVGPQPQMYSSGVMPSVGPSSAHISRVSLQSDTGTSGFSARQRSMT